MYDVYAMGNAIVDYEIEIDDDFLSKHGVEKSLMTLVDEPRQQELVQAVGSKIKKKQGGGSAANSIFTLAQMGGKGFYSCKVANDEDGQLYIEELGANEIATNLNPLRMPEGTTGKCLVMVTPDSERTMNTFLGITSDFSKNELIAEAIANAKYLFIEGYLITSDNGVEAMKRAKEIALQHGTKVSLTFSDPSMVKYFRDSMMEVASDGIDLLFCNEEEAMLYTDEQTLEDALISLKKTFNHFVVTLGKKGALVYDGEQLIEIEPFPTKAIDSTGAGDTFSGAFLYGITNGYSYELSGKLASLSASKVVSKYGPRLENQQLSEIAVMIKRLK